MTQVNTVIPKLNNQLENLQREVRSLRSFVIGLAGKDEEGNYKQSFVKKILDLSKEKIDHTFGDKRSFLTHLKK